MWRRWLRPPAAMAAGALAIVLVFRVGGGDRFLASLFYDPARHSFPLRDAWPLAVVGHTVLKWVALGLWAACAASGGRLRRGAVYMAVIAAIVLALKHASLASCPWNLPEYGGSRPDAGRCLPAAHPLTGFALFGLCLALRDGDDRRAAAATLTAAWVVGLGAGLVQMARGAHFASHVLWTAWVAGGVTWLLARVAHGRSGCP